LLFERGAVLIRNIRSLENPVTHRAEIWSIPADESVRADAVGKKILADSKLDLFQSKYSPDGRWIVFEGIRDLQSVLYVVPANGGTWVPITDGKHWCDKPRWSADGRLIYFLAESAGFINLWGIRFDHRTGETRGAASRITSFKNPRLMIPIYIPSIDFSLNRNALVLPIQEKSGSIWILDN
jgi:hypothetical protein